jgi:hypothetical protein
MRDARKKDHSKGGFVMSAKQSSWPPAHRRQDAAELYATLYTTTTTRLLFMHAAAKAFAFSNPFNIFCASAIATPTRRGEQRTENENYTNMWDKKALPLFPRSQYACNQLKKRIASLAHLEKTWTIYLYRFEFPLSVKYSGPRKI